MGGVKKIIWPVQDLDLFGEYGLDNLDFKGNYRSVLRLGSETTDYALKCVEYSRKKLLFLVEVQQFLEVRGFANFSRIIPTLRDEYFINTGNESYFLMEWIHGRESNFKDQNDLFTYISVVANLHRSTRGFGVATNNLSDKWSDKLQEVQEISTIQYRVSDEFLDILPGVVEFGQRALSLLQNEEVLKSTCQPLVVCHKDLTYRNLLIDPHNEGYLIDFDYAKADVPVRDLAQFLRKVWKRNNWDIDLGLRLLSSYSKDNLLSKGDLGLLLAYLYFPRSLRQLKSRIRKYDSNPAMLEDILQDVKSNLAIKPSLDRFARSLGY